MGYQRKDKKITMRDREEYQSQFGGSLTVQDFDKYREYINEQADQDIRMYWEFHINKKSLHTVAKEFGVSHMTVRNRINILLGRMNTIRGISS